MDTKAFIENLKADVTCSICVGYFTDPVTIKCGHSFCTVCLLQCRERANETWTCPECRGVIQDGDLVPSRNLQNLSITSKMLRPHLLQSLVGLTTCDQHGEKEKFFCEEDKTVLCDSCLLAPEHKDHQVLPLETAADKGKDKLQETCTVLQEKEEEFKATLDEMRRRETSWKEDVETWKQSIMSEYGKLHEFLWDEEYQYLQTLEEKFRDNLVKLEKNKAKLCQQIQNVQRMILEVEENLDKRPLEMLKDMKGTLKRSEECLLQEPELASLAWTTCSITGLRDMLKSFQRDITLDPDSAHPRLILSEDLKSVQYGSICQDLPDHKSRFNHLLAVLGAQSFTSGKHYWEVEVGDKTEWELGICKNSVSRKSRSHSSEDMRTLTCVKTERSFFLWNSQTGFRSSPPMKTVGIFLDYEKGHIAFYEATENCLIHSVSNIAFEGPLRPYFCPCLPNRESSPGSLIISQVE